MLCSKPYESPSTQINMRKSRRFRSVIIRLFVGFFLGASFPACVAAYGFYLVHDYQTSLAPGEVACGNAVLGPIMLQLVGMFGVPVVGLVGAGIAAVPPFWK
jgi:hypothetical protein